MIIKSFDNEEVTASLHLFGFVRTGWSSNIIFFLTKQFLIMLWLLYYHKSLDSIRALFPLLILLKLSMMGSNAHHRS